jgi:hypothetical protein
MDWLQLVVAIVVGVVTAAVPLAVNSAAQRLRSRPEPATPLQAATAAPAEQAANLPGPDTPPVAEQADVPPVAGEVDQARAQAGSKEQVNKQGTSNVPS